MCPSAHAALPLLLALAALPGCRTPAAGSPERSDTLATPNTGAPVVEPGPPVTPAAAATETIDEACRGSAIDLQKAVHGGACTGGGRQGQPTRQPTFELHVDPPTVNSGGAVEVTASFVNEDPNEPAWLEFVKPTALGSSVLGIRLLDLTKSRRAWS